MSLHLICLYPILGVSHTEPLLYLRLPGWLRSKQEQKYYVHKDYILSTTKHITVKLFILFLYKQVYSYANTSTEGADVSFFVNISREKNNPVTIST